MFSMFNIPNLFTACNMLCGVIAIFCAFAGRIDIAPYFIFLAAILDFFDGFLARLLKQQGELGKQLDSLADMISFGLAPGIIVLFMLVFSVMGHQIVFFDGFQEMNIPMTQKFYLAAQAWEMNLFINQVPPAYGALDNFQKFIPFVALIIPFFSMFRLAKFNIDTRQSESFIGLPTPANTIFFMAFPLLINQYGATKGWEHDLIMWLIQPAVFIPVIVIMSLLLVAEIPLFALKFKSFKWNGNQIRYLFLITCLILIPTLLVWSIPIIVLLYIVLSVIENILKKKTT